MRRSSGFFGKISCVAAGAARHRSTGGHMIAAAAHSSGCNSISVVGAVTAAPSYNRPSSGIAFSSHLPSPSASALQFGSLSKASAGIAVIEAAAVDLEQDLHVPVDSSSHRGNTLYCVASGLNSCVGPLATRSADGVALSTSEQAFGERRAAVEAGGAAATIPRSPVQAQREAGQPVANGENLHCFRPASDEGAGNVIKDSLVIGDSLVESHVKGGGGNSDGIGLRCYAEIPAGIPGGVGMVVTSPDATARGGSACSGAAASADGLATGNNHDVLSVPLCNTSSSRDADILPSHALSEAQQQYSSTFSLLAEDSTTQSERTSAASFAVTPDEDNPNLEAPTVFGGSEKTEEGHGEPQRDSAVATGPSDHSQQSVRSQPFRLQLRTSPPGGAPLKVNILTPDFFTRGGSCNNGDFADEEEFEVGDSERKDTHNTFWGEAIDAKEAVALCLRELGAVGGPEQQSTAATVWQGRETGSASVLTAEDNYSLFFTQRPAPPGHVDVEDQQQAPVSSGGVDEHAHIRRGEAEENHSTSADPEERQEEAGETEDAREVGTSVSDQRANAVSLLGDHEATVFEEEPPHQVDGDGASTLQTGLNDCLGGPGDGISPLIDDEVFSLVDLSHSCSGSGSDVSSNHSSQQQELNQEQELQLQEEGEEEEDGVHGGRTVAVAAAAQSAQQEESEQQEIDSASSGVPVVDSASRGVLVVDSANSGGLVVDSTDTSAYVDDETDGEETGQHEAGRTAVACVSDGRGPAVENVQQHTVVCHNIIVDGGGGMPAEESAEKLPCHGSLEIRGRGRGRSSKHPHDSHKHHKKGRPPAARRGRSDPRRQLLRSGGDATAIWGMTSGAMGGGASAVTRPIFAREERESSVESSAIQNTFGAFSGDLCFLEAFEGSTSAGGSGDIITDASSPPGLLPCSSTSSSRKRLQSRQHMGTAATAGRNAGQSGAVTGNPLDSKPFTGEPECRMATMQQQQQPQSRQAQHWQQQQHRQQLMSYAGGAQGSSGGISFSSSNMRTSGGRICTEGREDPRASSRTRQTWGVSQQSPHLTAQQHLQQWTQLSQHALQQGGGLYTQQQPQQLHSHQQQQQHMLPQQQHVLQQQQQHMLQQQQGMQLVLHSVGGRAEETPLFLQDIRLPQSSSGAAYAGGNVYGRPQHQQQQHPAEGWRHREQQQQHVVGGTGAQRVMDAHGGEFGDTTARGSTSRRRAGRWREKHSKYGESSAAAGGAAAAIGDSGGLHRRRRPAAASGGPPTSSQPSTSVRLTAEVLLQLEGRGPVQIPGLKIAPAASGMRRPGAAASLMNKEAGAAANPVLVATAARDTVAKGTGFVESAHEPKGSRRETNAFVTHEEGQGTAKSVTAAASAEGVDHPATAVAAAVAGASELSAGPCTDEPAEGSAVAGTQNAEEGVETNRQHEGSGVGGEQSTEAVDGKEQEPQPDTEEDKESLQHQQQLERQQQEEQNTWKAVLQQKLQQEEEQGGDLDSIFFWMVKQRAEELRERKSVAVHHCGDSGDQQQRRGVFAGGEERKSRQPGDQQQQPSGVALQQLRRTRPTAFERAEGLAGLRRDPSAMKLDWRLATKLRAAAQKCPELLDLAAGIAGTRQTRRQSSDSDVSSEESTKGTVNHRCRDESTRVNLCANPSDMWYGLCTSDGKPVVLPARPSRWYNSSSRRHRRMHRDGHHRKQQAHAAPSRLPFQVQQLQLQQQPQQPFQQQLQPQQQNPHPLHMHPQQVQQYQQQQQHLQQYQQQQQSQPYQQQQQLQQYQQQHLHQRTFSHSLLQQQQPGQQPSPHQQLSHYQPHGYAGVPAGYPASGSGWVGTQQGLGGRVQYTERDKPIAERGQVGRQPAGGGRTHVFSSATAPAAERTKAFSVATTRETTQVFSSAGGGAERRHPIQPSADIGEPASSVHTGGVERGAGQQGFPGSRWQIPGHIVQQGLPSHAQQHASYQQQQQPLVGWGSGSTSNLRNACVADEMAAGAGNNQQRPQQSRPNRHVNQQQQQQTQLPAQQQSQAFTSGSKQATHQLHHSHRRHRYHELKKKRARLSLSSAVSGAQGGMSVSTAGAPEAAGPATTTTVAATLPSTPAIGEESGVLRSNKNAAQIVSQPQHQQQQPQQQQQQQQYPVQQQQQQQYPVQQHWPQQQPSRQRRRHPHHSHSRGHGGIKSSGSASRRGRGNDRLVYMCAETAASGGQAATAVAVTPAPSAADVDTEGPPVTGVPVSIGQSSDSCSEEAAVRDPSKVVDAAGAHGEEAVGASVVRNTVTPGVAAADTLLRNAGEEVYSFEGSDSTAPVPGGFNGVEQGNAASASVQPDDTLSATPSPAPATAEMGVSGEDALRVQPGGSVSDVVGVSTRTAEETLKGKGRLPRDDTPLSPQRAPRRARLDESGAFRPVTASSVSDGAGGAGGVLRGGAPRRRKTIAQEGSSQETTAVTSTRGGARTHQIDGVFKVPQPLPFFKKIRRGGTATATTVTTTTTASEGALGPTTTTTSSSPSRAAAVFGTEVKGREGGTPLTICSTSSTSARSNSTRTNFSVPLSDAFPVKPLTYSIVATAAAGAPPLPSTVATPTFSTSAESVRTSASALSTRSSVTSVRCASGGSSCSSICSSSLLTGSMSISSPSVRSGSTYGGGVDHQRPLPSYRDLYFDKSHHSGLVAGVTSATTMTPCSSNVEEQAAIGDGSSSRRGFATLRSVVDNSKSAAQHVEACHTVEACHPTGRGGVTTSAARLATSLLSNDESLFHITQGGTDGRGVVDNTGPLTTNSILVNSDAPVLRTQAVLCPAATSSNSGAAGEGTGGRGDVAGAFSNDSRISGVCSTTASGFAVGNIAAAVVAPTAGNVALNASSIATRSTSWPSDATTLSTVSTPPQVGVVVERGSISKPSAAVYFDTPFRRGKPSRGGAGLGVGGSSSSSSSKKKSSRKKSHTSSSSSAPQMWGATAREHVQWQLAKSRGTL